MKTQAKERVQIFQDLLGRKHLKCTYERQHLYETAGALKGHFTADDLYAVLKKKGFRIARGTVFRTIPLLLESGIIQKSVGDGKGDFYESRTRKEHHDHMVCIGCKKVIEFYSPQIEKAQEEACQNYKFKPTFHDHRIFGYCTKCQ